MTCFIHASQCAKYSLILSIPCVGEITFVAYKQDLEDLPATFKLHCYFINPWEPFPLLKPNKQQGGPTAPGRHNSLCVFYSIFLFF